MFLNAEFQATVGFELRITPHALRITYYASNCYGVTGNVRQAFWRAAATSAADNWFLVTH